MTRLKSLLPSVFVLPVAYLVWAGFTARLGANPVEKVIHMTGDWALNFMILAMATRTLAGIPLLQWTSSYHKAAGWSVFSYAALHFLTYAAAEHNFSMTEIIGDAVTHTRIVFGVLALALVTAAVTVTMPRIVKTIDFTRIRRFHKTAVYPAAASAVIHYVWLVKKDIRTPLIYAAAIAVLAAYRAISVITIKLWRHNRH